MCGLIPAAGLLLRFWKFKKICSSILAHHVLLVGDGREVVQ